MVHLFVFRFNFQFNKDLDIGSFRSRTQCAQLPYISGVYCRYHDNYQSSKFFQSSPISYSKAKLKRGIFQAAIVFIKKVNHSFWRCSLCGSAWRVRQELPSWQTDYRHVLPRQNCRIQFPFFFIPVFNTKYSLLFFFFAISILLKK